MNKLTILKKPLITEKNYKLVAQQKYVFAIDSKANKTDVKSAFETIFATKVKAVNIIQNKSKPRRIGRFAGRTKPVKKAIITLFPGDKLNLLDNVDESAEKETTVDQNKSIFARFKEQFINLRPKTDNQEDKKK